MLDKIQFVEALTPTYDVTYTIMLPESVYVLQKYHFTMQP